MMIMMMMVIMMIDGLCHHIKGRGAQKWSQIPTSLASSQAVQVPVSEQLCGGAQ